MKYDCLIPLLSDQTFGDRSIDGGDSRRVKYWHPIKRKSFEVTRYDSGLVYVTYDGGDKFSFPIQLILEFRVVLEERV